eukprot:g4903.t1
MNYSYKIIFETAQESISIHEASVLEVEPIEGLEPNGAPPFYDDSSVFKEAPVYEPVTDFIQPFVIPESSKVSIASLEPEFTPEVLIELEPELTPQTSMKLEPEIIPEIIPEMLIEMEPNFMSEISIELEPELTSEMLIELEPELTSHTMTGIEPEFTSESLVELEPEYAPELLIELDPLAAPSITETEDTEDVYPSLAWREVGRLAQDLTFEKGPSTSFALAFDPVDNTPYLAFTIERSNDTHPKTVWTSSFSRQDDTCLLRYYDQETGLWKNYVTLLESAQNVPCKTPGNIFIDAYEGIDESDQTVYVLYSSWVDQDRTTVVYKIRLIDNHQVDLEFPVYLDPSRFIEFKRNPYDGKIYIMARLRTDEESALLGNEIYPVLYSLEGDRWIDITRPTFGNDNSYVYYYAMTFLPDGGVLVAYILRSDTQTIHLMSCDGISREWTDRLSIHHTDLLGSEQYEAFFLDGMKFATDSSGNIYLYFKTFRHVESWPDNAFTATLWILALDKTNVNSSEVYLVLDGIYGAFSSIQDDYLNDKTLGHFVFDNIGVFLY